MATREANLEGLIRKGRVFFYWSSERKCTAEESDWQN